jgi:tetratricopeptide (TPR) repeat protein
VNPTRHRLLLPLVLLGLLLGVGCQDPTARVEAHRQKGEAALADGRHAEAIVEFKSILLVEPNDPAAHWALARAYLADGRIREGFWELQETVRLDPANTDARLRYGQILLSGSEEDRAKALEQAEALIEAKPEGWRAWLLKGRALELLGRDDEAREAYEAARERAPEHGAPLYMLAEFHRRHGDREAAEPLYRELVEREGNAAAWRALAAFLAADRRHDDEAEAAYRAALERATPAERGRARRELAGFLFARDRFAAAEAVLREAIADDPDDFALLRALAEMHDRAGDPAEAEAVLLEAVEARPDDPRPLLVVSQYRERRGDLAGALEAAEQALAIRPDAVVSRVRKAELLIALGMAEDDPQPTAQGRAIVNALLGGDPNLPEALYVQARLQIVEQKYEEAIQSLSRALDRRADWPEAHTLLGRALALNGDLRGARSSFARALELDPGLLDAQRGLARIQADLGEYEQAVEVGRRALHAKPDDLALQLAVAQSLLRLGKPEEALAQLQQIPFAQHDAQTIYALGRIELARGELERARPALERAHALDPTRYEVLDALLELDGREGRLDESAARIQAAVQAAPDRSRLQQLRAEVAQRRGDTGAAEDAWRRAIELDPNDLGAYHGLVGFLEASGRTDEMLRTLERGLEANPRNGLLSLQVGTIYEAQGRASEARERYEEALRLDPGLVVAKNNLAYLLTERGEDLDRALDLAQEAKSVLPNNPLVSDTLGWVLYKKAIPSAAVGYLREAEQGLPEGSPYLGLVRLHLTLAYEANGEADAARETAARALRGVESAGAGDAPPPPWLAELEAAQRRLGEADDAPSSEG